MAFKSLEARYNEKVKDLYTGAKYKFENGKASRGANDDPLIVRNPGDGYFGGISRALGRSLPVSSALQDVKRLTLFTLSVRGITFLAKQQLLQTGNAFEQTRLINPLFVLGAAAAPGIGNIIRIRRNLRPLTGPFGILKKRPSTSYEDVRKIGQLQKSTYDEFGAKGVGGFLKKLISPITNTVSAFTAKKNVGEHFGYDTAGWKKTRPELGTDDAKYTNAKKLVKPAVPTGGGLLGAVVSAVLSNLNSVGKFDQGGVVTTFTFLGQKYGPITNSSNWDGKYTTYLDFSNTKTQWFHGAYRKRKVAPGEPVSNGTSAEPFGEPKLSPTAVKNTILKNYNEFKFDNGDGIRKTVQDSAWNGRYETGKYLDFDGEYRRPIIPQGRPLINNDDTTTVVGEPRLSEDAQADSMLQTYENLLNDDEGLSVDATVKLASEIYFDNQISLQTDKTFLAAGAETGSFRTPSRKFIKYFGAGAGAVVSSQTFNSQESNARSQAEGAKLLVPNENISFIYDPSNLPSITENSSLQPAYKPINNDFEDPVNVSFAMGKDAPVKFRAYIKDLVQSIKPEYKSYQYIGRVEKFISYITVQRSIQFKLGIVAFSKDEIQGMWRRLNYLTGLAYPYGFNRGILQPNIARLTIGDVYTDQPGYIDSISTNFSELSESWDIDYEVPIAATVDIQFVIIEKTSKIADSPFYGITDSSDGFTSFVPSAAPDLAAQTNENPTPIETPEPEAIVLPERKQTAVLTQTEVRPRGVIPAPVDPNSVRLPTRPGNP